MSLPPEEQFRLDVMKSLGSIEDRGIRNELQLIAQNTTMSDQGQRISRLESAWSTVRGIAVGAVALSCAAIASVFAWFMRP